MSLDHVDIEQVSMPRTWDILGIRRFMISCGLVSSTFDVVTFLVLIFIFHANATLFRSGWFVESVATELAVVLVLRTNRLFFKSRPGTPLLLASAGIGLVTVVLPYSPLAGPWGFTGIPVSLLLALAAITLLYVASAEILKQRLRIRMPAHATRKAT